MTSQVNRQNPLGLKPGDKIEATIAQWGEAPKRKGSFGGDAASYGIVILVNGETIHKLWGHGYSPNPEPIIVFAIIRLLSLIPEDIPFKVHALASLKEYVKLPGGWGREAMKYGGRRNHGTGKVLNCWPAIGEIIKAMDAGRWSLVPFRKDDTPPLYWIAESMALGVAMQAAFKHKGPHGPDMMIDRREPIIVHETIA